MPSKSPKPARKATKKVLATTEREVLNTQDAAAFLGIAPRTLRRMAEAGEIPARRIGDRGVFRFSRQALLEWLGAQ